MNLSYFSTPDFVFQSFHLLFFLELPVHILGAYCIMFKTPDNMKSVKWTLLKFHFWTVFLDWGISIFACPFMLFPEMAGFSMGLLAQIGVPTRFHPHIIFSLFSCSAISVLSVVENRFYVLIGGNETWRKIRVWFLSVNYLAAPIFFLTLYSRMPDQKLAVESLKVKLPNLPPAMFEQSILVLAEDCQYLATTLMIFFGIVIDEIMVFLFLVNINLEKRLKRATLSSETMKMHRKFMGAVMVQALVSFSILVLPLLYLGPSAIFNYHNQAFNNISMIIMSLHGLGSSFVMLYMHDSYRKFCRKILLNWKFWRKITKRTKVYAVSNSDNEQIVN